MPSKPKTQRKETTPEERAVVWARYCDGMTYSQIKASTKLHRSTIGSIIARTKKLTGKDKFHSKPRSGAPPKITSTGERALIWHTKQNTKEPLIVLATPSKSGQQLSQFTVRKILKRNGISRRRARKKPYLTKIHKKLRFKRCKEIKGDKSVDPMRICWSDKATFELGHNGRVIYVSRAINKEFLEKNLKPSFKSGRSSVSVWAAFCKRHIGPIVILPKGQRMNQQMYTDFIFKPHFLPFYRKMKRIYGTRIKPVWFQEDGASYHTAGIPSRYKTAQRVKALNWPAQSPDLSPIENLWKIVKDRIAKRRHRIKSIDEMSQAIINELSIVEEDLLEKLAKSFLNRLNLCIAAKGGSIKY